MTKPPITALAPWMGCKRKLAPHIEKLAGPHDSLFVNFSGSMAVPLAWQPCRHEVVNDLNQDMTNVSYCLQRPHLGRDLLSFLNYTICSQKLYLLSRQIILTPFAGDLGNVERAGHALIFWWMGRNGIAGTKPHGTGFSVRYTPRGGSGGVRFRNFVSSVPWFMNRMSRMDVLCEDGISMLKKIEDLPGTVIYSDPPYVKKAKPYLHDFKTEDHRQLAVEASRFRKARVIVSYYPDPLIDEIYPADRWHRIEIITNKNIRNTVTRKCGATKATELLLCNFKPAGDRNLFV